MESLDFKKASDEDLESIVRKAENSHISGSQFEKAKLELEIRRNRKIFEAQDHLLTTLQDRLDKIASTLRSIGQRPIKSALLASAGAIVIGVTISVLSAYLQKVFGL